MSQSLAPSGRHCQGGQVSPAAEVSGRAEGEPRDESAEPLGLVTNVQRFCIHDGPGIRTTSFLKGCPLLCFWCHNPEDRLPRPEVQFHADRCRACGVCCEVCPEGAQLLVQGERRFRRDLCRACGLCAEHCGSDALEIAGRYWTTQALVAALQRDEPFYRQSGGGVTLSGGEPLMQGAFCVSVLKGCREAGLHTAVETSACCSWAELKAVLAWTDLAIVDLKLVDEAQHRACTGASNVGILRNIRMLAGEPVSVVVRTPVVPTINDSVEAVGAIAALIRDLPNLLYYEFMPFHRLAEGKYRSLGHPYEAARVSPPSRSALEALVEAARAAGVRDVRIG